MKILSFIMLSFLSTSALAINFDYKDYKSLGEKERVEVFKAYKDFLSSNIVELADSSRSTSRWEFITSAFASGNYNCFYAGWPSEKKQFAKRRLCTSPANTNSDYNSAACGANSLQCQPLLFGEGLCASTANRRLRNSAFAQCEKKFQQSGKSISELANKLAHSELANKAEELFSTVERICAEENPPICRSLEAKVAEIKRQMPALSVAVSEEPAEADIQTQALEQFKKVQETLSRSGTVDCVLEHDHNLDREIASVTQTDDENDQVLDQGPGFDRIHSRFDLCLNSRGISPAAREMYCLANDGSKPASGFSIKSNAGHPYFPEANLMGKSPERQIDIRSKDNALNDTYLYLGDYSGGPDSHNVKSMMFLLPRRSPPVAAIQGNELHVTLQTGEKVVFDAQTGAVKNGVLIEGVPDFNPNRHARRPPNVNYNGSGISIRLDHRYEHPTSSSGDPTAQIKQGSKVCEVPRAQLFDNEGKLKSTTDSDLLNSINTSCPGKGFSL